MSVHLVFVHGRAQEHKDAARLKQDWLDSLKRGLGEHGLTLPLAESAVHFPYYGQTLYDLWAQVPDDQVAEIVIKGRDAGDRQQLAFMASVLEEVQHARGISDEQVLAASALDTVPKGVLQWEWVQGILAAIDTHLPGASGLSVALATNDVYQYLNNPALAARIRQGVAQAIPPGEPTIVVAHSLGTVVAYDLLRSAGAANGWNVPLLVTVGSPLGVTAVKRALRPLDFPSCVGAWFNAMDPQDVVALYPLDSDHFGIEPPIENKTDVRNHTPNKHGIVGYLDDADVARRIHDALVAAQQPGASRPAPASGARHAERTGERP